MIKHTVATVAVLLMSITAGYATTTQQITGTYTLTYTPGTGAGSGGATGAPAFSSTPGDGAVANNLYSSTFGSTAGRTPDTVSSVGFTQTLTVGGAATTYNLFTVAPTGTCGSNCNGVINPLTNTTNTTSGTITASFTFTTPSGATGNATDTATYYADYNGGSPNLGTNCPGGSASQTDCVFWSTANDPIVVTFTDGYTLKATLNNATDWNITPTISLALSNTTKVPEPASLAVLGSAIGALGLIRRRRTKA